ncbi:hypothetical protein [Hymenobacter jeollabukensis]|uniref:Uncharacterized protein n=1 Tax=Hymenobacter jeollabukensis TaxID=2025313 RepID=A0A5R8WPW7_9BACT|nr:hypothetical protein [Hymenobacter jeollabukensis]TLM92344.1 hypothetical protein FDY95_12990 [Hymenobacter jeollabukensis]
MADILSTTPPASLPQWLRGSLARAGLGLGLIGFIWYLSSLALELESGDHAVFGFLLLLLVLAHAATTRLLVRQVGAFLELDDEAPDSPWLLRLAASAWWVLLLLLSGALILSDVALLLFALAWLFPEPNYGPSWTMLMVDVGSGALV